MEILTRNATDQSLDGLSIINFPYNDQVLLRRGLFLAFMIALSEQTIALRVMEDASMLLAWGK